MLKTNQILKVVPPLILDVENTAEKSETSCVGPMPCCFIGLLYNNTYALREKSCNHAVTF